MRARTHTHSTHAGARPEQVPAIVQAHAHMPSSYRLLPLSPAAPEPLVLHLLHTLLVPMRVCVFAIVCVCVCARALAYTIAY